MYLKKATDWDLELLKLIITCQLYPFQKSTSTTNLQWRFVVDARATFMWH